MHAPHEKKEETHASPVAAQPMETTPQPSPYSHSVEPFGKGFRIHLHTPNLRLELLTLGASVNSCKVRDPHKAAGAPDEWVECCLGYNDADECEDPAALIGISPGRFAGRIGGGEFVLNGTTYKLLQNDGPNTLHGGPVGFSHLQWKYLVTEGDDELGCEFHLVSPHLDQGFPGELFVTATISISKTATTPTLKFEYKATLAENTPVSATVVNLTNHTYWNLNGVPRAAQPSDKCPLPHDISNHYFQIHSKYFAATDDALIPSGEMRPTEGTVHDYTTMRCVKDGLEDTKTWRDLWGYDDPVALETWDSKLREAIVFYSPITKLQMRVCTTNPAVVVYTANHLPVDADGTKGKRFQQHGAVCCECQYFPNSPNVASFPSTTLSKGETYLERTEHEFKFLSAPPKTA